MNWLDEYENALEKNINETPCGSPIARTIFIKEEIYARMVEKENITRSEAMETLNDLIWNKQSDEIKAFKELLVLRHR